MSESVGTAGGQSATSSGTTGAAPAATQSQSAPQTGQTQAQGQQQSAGANQGAEATPAPEKRYLESAHEDALVKVKIDGQERELSIKELKRLTSLEQASQKRMQEAQRLRTEAQRERELFKADPEAWAKASGVDLDAFSEERLARKYEIAQMSPEQRRIMDLEAQVDQTRKLDLQSKQSLIADIKELTGEDITPEQAQGIPKERLVQYLQEKQNEYRTYQGNLENEVLTAWKETALPADPMFGQWVAAALLNDQKLINAGKKDGPPLQAKEAAAKVKAKLTNSVRSMFQQMDAPAIQEFLGKELCNKLREYDVQRVTDSAPNGFDKGPGSQPVSKEPKKAMNETEWRAYMGIA